MSSEINCAYCDGSGGHKAFPSRPCPKCGKKSDGLKKNRGFSGGRVIGSAEGGFPRIPIDQAEEALRCLKRQKDLSEANVVLLFRRAYLNNAEVYHAVNLTNRMAAQFLRNSVEDPTGDEPKEMQVRLGMMATFVRALADQIERGVHMDRFGND